MSSLHTTLPRASYTSEEVFEADIPLWAGSNLVQVFARESNEVQSLQTVVVLKRASDGNIVAQPSPAEAPAAPAKK